MSEKTRVALIGAGLMGRGLGRNMLAGGFPLTVFDLNPEAVADLVDRGAEEGASAAGAARTADVIVTCLPSLAAVRAVFEGSEGIIETARPGSVIVDATTNDPDLTRTLGAAAAARGVEMLDAPMLGRPIQADEGKLRFVVGGDPAALERVRPVLDTMSVEIVYAGELGSGQMLKIINNGVIGGVHAMICEGFTLARKLGVDLEALYHVTSNSNAEGRKLHDLGPRFINDEHTMAFAVDTMLKDITMYSKIAVDAGVPAFVGEAARNVLALTSALGFGKDNNSHIGTALAQLAGTRFPKKDD